MILRTHHMLATLLLACLLLLSACGGAMALRDAQDHYNRGVEIENLATIQAWSPRTDKDVTPLVPILEDPNVHYYACLSVLAELDDAELSRDDLLTTRRILEAMCLWRLGKAKDARSAVDRARKSINDATGPRDRAFITALPGFIKMDEARNELGKAKALQDAGARASEASAIERMLFSGADSAQHVIANARSTSGITNDLKIALYWYELEVYNVWEEVVFELRDGAEISEERQCRIGELLEELRQAGATALANRLKTEMQDKNCD